MELASDRSTTELIEEMDRRHAIASTALYELFHFIREADRREVWRSDGCRDMAQWVSARYGPSNWVASLWVQAAHKLADLPVISRAFQSGELCVDKVVHLARFATPIDEAKLVTWARRVTPGWIKRKAELAERPAIEDVQAAEYNRSLTYRWFADDKLLAIEGWLPAAEGQLFIKALDRIADTLVPSPEDASGVEYDGTPTTIDVRRADALVALASMHVAEDADADRATVVVHADLSVLAGAEGACEIEGGPVIHPDTARRLACDARIQVVVNGEDGRPIGVGRTSRNVPEWLKRQVRNRDHGCVFPGCGSRRFVDAHHIWWWDRGGPHELDNLVLLCKFHHKLVHEHRWRVALGTSGSVSWFRPDGSPYEPQFAPGATPTRGPPGRRIAAR